jgi:hypothetical protein
MTTGVSLNDAAPKLQLFISTSSPSKSFRHSEEKDKSKLLIEGRKVFPVYYPTRALSAAFLSSQFVTACINAAPTPCFASRGEPSYLLS